MSLFLLIRGVEVEINPAERPGAVGLTEDDGQLTVERNAMAEICANNLIAGVSGQKLPTWVNPEVAAKRNAST